MQGADFLLGKTRSLVDRYGTVEELRRGTSWSSASSKAAGRRSSSSSSARAAWWPSTTNPRPSSLRDHIVRKGLGDVVRIHDDVDQSDRGRLAEVVEDGSAMSPSIWSSRLFPPLRADPRVVQRAVPAAAPRRALRDRGLALGPGAAREPVGGRGAANPADLRAGPRDPGRSRADRRGRGRGRFRPGPARRRESRSERVSDLGFRIRGPTPDRTRGRLGPRAQAATERPEGLGQAQLVLSRIESASRCARSPPRAPHRVVPWTRRAGAVSPWSEAGGKPRCPSRRPPRPPREARAVRVGAGSGRCPPLLRQPDEGSGPGLGVVDQVERVVVDRAEVGRHDLLAGGPRLHADVEVVAVELAQRLVEAQLAHRPRREHHDEAVDRVDLSGPA